MPATVECRVFRGTGTTSDVINGGTAWFSLADDQTSNAGGVTKPGTGTNYSWVRNVRAYVTVAPIHKVENIRFFMTGTAPTGVDIRVKVSTTFIQGSTQTTTALTSTASMFAYTAAVPLAVDGNFTTGTDTAPKAIADFAVLQMSVASTATVANNVLAGSFYMRYDES